MFDKNKDILPIGSVVLLKGAKLRLMIIGLFPLLEDGVSYYDYSACVYPEGMVNSKTMGFFNRESIDKVFSIGLMDDGTNNFMKFIKDQEQSILNNPNLVKRTKDDLEDIFLTQNK